MATNVPSEHFESPEFESELPTLKCAKICGSCGPRFGRPCADSYTEDGTYEVPDPGGVVAQAAWEEDKTEPEVAPAFLRGYDDDYLLDGLDDELGGESG